MAKKDIRKWVNENSAVVTIAAVVLLALTIWAIYSQMSGRSFDPDAQRVWFYDLKSGGVFAVDADTVPPIETDSGPLANGMPAGVRAHVFACGSCETDAQFVAWVEMELPRDKAMALLRANKDGDGSSGPDASELHAGDRTFVMAGDVPVPPELVGRWVQRNSRPGFQITEAVGERCGGQNSPNPCNPDMGTPPVGDLRSQ
ncbi:MAG: hypothetical protein R3336_08620 [Phycisphaeraceae bacterium]|nr:hypothetical protein [Phycisphaeraceae bacterium]